jgi:hypothetical protein
MPTGTARILYILGLVLMLLAITDVLLARFARINVTNVTWSPIALGGTGIILMQVARFMSMTGRSQTDDDGQDAS